MAFIAGKGYAILNSKAEKGDQKAKELLAKLDSIDQEEADRLFSEILGKGGGGSKKDKKIKAPGASATDGQQKITEGAGEQPPSGKVEPKKETKKSKPADPLSNENLQALFDSGLDVDGVIDEVRKQTSDANFGPEDPFSDGDLQSIVEAFEMGYKPGNKPAKESNVSSQFKDANDASKFSVFTAVKDAIDDDLDFDENEIQEIADGYGVSTNEVNEIIRGYQKQKQKGTQIDTTGANVQPAGAFGDIEPETLQLASAETKPEATWTKRQEKLLSNVLEKEFKELIDEEIEFNDFEIEKAAFEYNVDKDDLKKYIGEYAKKNNDAKEAQRQESIRQKKQTPGFNVEEEVINRLNEIDDEVFGIEEEEYEQVAAEYGITTEEAKNIFKGKSLADNTVPREPRTSFEVGDPNNLTPDEFDRLDFEAKQSAETKINELKQEGRISNEEAEQVAREFNIPVADVLDIIGDQDNYDETRRNINEKYKDKLPQGFSFAFDNDEKEYIVDERTGDFYEIQETSDGNLLIPELGIQGKNLEQLTQGFNAPGEFLDKAAPGFGAAREKRDAEEEQNPLSRTENLRMQELINSGEEQNPLSRTENLRMQELINSGEEQQPKRNNETQRQVAALDTEIERIRNTQYRNPDDAKNFVDDITNYESDGKALTEGEFNYYASQNNLTKDEAEKAYQEYGDKVYDNKPYSWDEPKPKRTVTGLQQAQGQGVKTPKPATTAKAAPDRKKLERAAEDLGVDANLLEGLLELLKKVR